MPQTTNHSDLRQNDLNQPLLPGNQEPIALPGEIQRQIALLSPGNQEPTALSVEIQRQSAPDPEVVISNVKQKIVFCGKVSSGFVELIFEEPKQEPQEEMKRPYFYFTAYTLNLIALIVVLAKVISSCGRRIYSLYDLFYNPHYIVTPWFEDVPSPVKTSLVVFGATTDAFLNIFTRGPSTCRMLRAAASRFTELKHVIELSAVESDRTAGTSTSLNNITIKSVFICGLISSVFGSLSAYLGGKTGFKNIISNNGLLIGIGTFVALVNLTTNISFKVEKGKKNTENFLQGPRKWNTCYFVVSLIGVIAFFGDSYYSTSHSLRLIVSDCLGGSNQADSSLLSDDWESIISTMAFISLSVALVSYITSSCLGFFIEKKKDQECTYSTEVITRRADFLITAMKSDKQEDSNSRILRNYLTNFLSLPCSLCETAYNFYNGNDPTLRFNFWYALNTWMPLIKYGEIIANAVVTFNSMNELILKVADMFSQDEGSLSSGAVAPVIAISIFTVALNAIIYAKFNFPEMELMIHRNMLRYALKILTEQHVKATIFSHSFQGADSDKLKICYAELSQFDQECLDYKPEEERRPGEVELTMH